MSNCNSSKSSSSLSRSSSFSEDFDDSVADATYCPKSPQKESGSEDSNEETFNPSANSTTVFRPLLENCSRDTASTVVQQSVDCTKRMLKSGLIYTTEGFVSIIRSAKKKGDPFNVNELCFEDFLDLKILANDIGPLNMTDLKLSLVKIIGVQRESPNSVFYKTDYANEKFKEEIVIKKKTQAKAISLNKAFHTKPSTPENKRADINELIKKSYSKFL